MTRTPAQLATQLVEAFGRPDDIVTVLAEDATWWITPTIPPEIMQNVSTGRDVIHGNMQRVFSLLYKGETMKTTVHSAISEGSLGTVRFTLTGEFQLTRPKLDQRHIVPTAAMVPGIIIRRNRAPAANGQTAA